ASQYNFLPSRYARAAMITATECANPCRTVAFGCCRLRRQANQFVICEGSLSLVDVGSAARLPETVMYFSARETDGSSSCVPFSSTHFKRGPPSPPMLMSVAFFPM